MSMMKLYAISDLPLGVPDNRSALASLPYYPHDWLIIAGDTRETGEHLHYALSILTNRFLPRSKLLLGLKRQTLFVLMNFSFILPHTYLEVLGAKHAVSTLNSVSNSFHQLTLLFSSITFQFARQAAFDAVPLLKRKELFSNAGPVKKLILKGED